MGSEMCIRDRGGGACYDIRELKNINKICSKYGFPIHLDGARLWNAMIATDTKPSDYGEIFDTISVCFSKGLGAPVGSALICSKKNYEKALRIRKKAMEGNFDDEMKPCHYCPYELGRYRRDDVSLDYEKGLDYE